MPRGPEPSLLTLWILGIFLTGGVVGLGLLTGQLRIGARFAFPAPPAAFVPAPLPPAAAQDCEPRVIQLLDGDMGAPFSDLEARCPLGTVPTLNRFELSIGTGLVLECVCPDPWVPDAESNADTEVTK